MFNLIKTMKLLQFSKFRHYPNYLKPKQIIIILKLEKNLTQKTKKTQN